MRSDLLHVVSVYSNPMRWESRERLFRNFVKHMQESGVRLTVVETAYGDIPHKFEFEDVNVVRVHAKTHLWIKESMIQKGLTSLPPDAKYIGILDGDIEFQHPQWASEAVHMLQHFDIGQRR